MGQAVAMASPAGVRGRALALALALAAHLALLLALAFDLSRNDGEPNAPDDLVALNVELSSPRPIPRPTRRTARRAPAPASKPAARPAPAAATPDSPSPPVPEAPAAPAPDARVLAVLRGSVGCGHATVVRLTDAERRACEERAERLAANTPERDLALPPEARGEFDLAWQENHRPPHMATIGCFATFGGGKLTWYHPSRGVKLGPLPCYIATPKATFLPDKEPPKGF